MFNFIFQLKRAWKVRRRMCWALPPSSGVRVDPWMRNKSQGFKVFHIHFFSKGFYTHLIEAYGRFFSDPIFLYLLHKSFISLIVF